MAQDILITPGSGEPQILFRGSGTNDTPLELNVLSSYQSASTSGTALIFEGTEGQLFSITDNLTSGVIFSIADIAGLPFLEIDASGDVRFIEYGRYVGIGTGVPSYELDVFGTGRFSSGVIFPDGVRQIIAYTGTASSGTSYTAGSGLTLDGDEFNIYGGTGHFLQVQAGDILVSGNRMDRLAQTSRYSSYLGTIALHFGTTNSEFYLVKSGSISPSTMGAGGIDFQMTRSSNLQSARGGDSLILGGARNWVEGQYNFIGGGEDNLIDDAPGASILNGKNNTIDEPNGTSIAAVILNGQNNYARGRYSAVIGTNNKIWCTSATAYDANNASILGADNLNSGTYSTIIGRTSHIPGEETDNSNFRGNLIVGGDSYIDKKGSASFGSSNYISSIFSYIVGVRNEIYGDYSASFGNLNYTDSSGILSFIRGHKGRARIRNENCISNFDHNQTGDAQKSSFLIKCSGNDENIKYLTLDGVGNTGSSNVNLKMPDYICTWNFKVGMSIFDVTSGNGGSYFVNGCIGGDPGNYIKIINTGTPERYFNNILSGIQVYVEPHTGTHSLMVSVSGISGLETRYNASVDVVYCGGSV